MRRWQVPFLGLIAVLLTLSGCAGRGVQAVSWPGLIVVDETIYAANVESIDALNAETGKILWSYPLEEEGKAGPFYATPVLAEDFGAHGVLLAASFSGQVYALALGESVAERPDYMWQFDGASGQYVGSGVVAGGTFIIGNGDGNVYALDIADGSVFWQFATRDRIWATPVVHEDIVYVASLDRHLYALDVATGEEIWQLELGGAIAGTPVIVDGSLWVGDFAKNIYRVNPLTGTIAFTYPTENWIWATPIEHNGILYFVDVGGHAYALNTETETMIWSEPAALGDTVRGQPVLNLERGLLYVPGYETGEIFAVSTETGARIQWGVVEKTQGRLPGDLVASAERLYTMPVLVDARIRALDMNDGIVLWVFPPTEN